MKLLKASVTTGFFCSLWTSQALAHHAMGGDTPVSIGDGLLSGLAHPVIGIDHFAFLIAMGIAAAFTLRPRLGPLAFVFATVAGCLLTVAGVRLPGIEIAVAASVVVVGAIVVSGREFNGKVLLTLFSAAGIMHGMAYAGAIVGAEQAPLFAYLTGFAGIEAAIALAAGSLARRFADAECVAALHPRLAGAVATGVGVAILFENLEGVLFTV